MAEIRPRVVKHSAVSAQVFELKEQAHGEINLITDKVPIRFCCAESIFVFTPPLAFR